MHTLHAVKSDPTWVVELRVYFYSFPSLEDYDTGTMMLIVVVPCRKLIVKCRN
jgi:hypothetical protein